jgi:hypothetical protein
VTACAEAVRVPGDPRPLAARRVDALVQICADVVAGGGWAGVKLPDRGRGRPRVNITVPYSVLLGHRAPCELAGYGPVCAEQALPLIGAGDLYRMLVDPVSGRLLDYGRTRYRPPPHLAEFVRARDGQCPIPCCHQPADRSEVDHVVPAAPDPVTGLPTRGGTCADNLAAPCPHHHHSKDAGRGFTLHRAADGTYTWTTPLGRVYTWRPARLWHPDTDHPPHRNPDPRARRAGGGTSTHPVGDPAGGGDPTDTAGDMPVCDCPHTCSCQQASRGTATGTGASAGTAEAMPVTSDDGCPGTGRAIPVTTGDDWADEFPAPGSDQNLDPSDQCRKPPGERANAAAHGLDERFDVVELPGACASADGTAADVVTSPADDPGDPPF